MKSILSKEISLFKNYFSPRNPSTINLLQYLQGGLNNAPFLRPQNWVYKRMIKPEYSPYLDKYFIGQPLKKCVELYRKDRSEKGKTDFNNLTKKLFPSVTVSGTFTKRANDDLIQHSGLMCLDVDYQDNTSIANFDHLKDQLCNLNNVAYCGLSVSGNGYFIIIPILYPDKHEQHFDSLKNDFNSFGLSVDESCRDVSRLRGFSVDKDAYFNHSAVPYTNLFKPVPPPRKTYTSFTAKTNIGTGAKVEKLIEEICRQRIDLTFDYADWYSIGCAFANEFGEIGRNYFHLVSQFHSKYDHGETDKQYNACLKSSSSATINTFYYLCKSKDVLIKKLCYSK